MSLYKTYKICQKGQKFDFFRKIELLTDGLRGKLNLRLSGKWPKIK